MTEENITPLQQLAERLHKHLCEVKGTEMCGWFGIDIPWKQISKFKHSEIYFHKAEQLLSVCNGDFDLAERIIEALWPTMKFMK